MMAGCISIKDADSYFSTTKYEAEEYDVYSTALDHLLSRLPENAAASPIYIRNQTTTSCSVKDLSKQCALLAKTSKKKLPPVSQETIENYAAKNQAGSGVRPMFVMERQYRMLDDEELNRLFKKPARVAWEEFHKRYPAAQGFYTLSRPGFDLEAGEAAVYIKHTIDGKIDGMIVFLSKGLQGWRVVGSSALK
jgi:hypothetical protein